MRVTGGVLRGRPIRVPDSRVRPTQDRVRQALFSILGQHLEHTAFLDLFAGSGAVGIEAWSRGARPVAWVEGDRRVARILVENVRNLCGTTETVYRMKIEQFLACGPVTTPYDMVFADPPYGRGDLRLAGRTKRDNGPASGIGWPEWLLHQLRSVRILAPNGCFVLEQSVAEALPGVIPGWRMTAEKRFGDSLLRFFKLEKAGV